MTGPGSSDAARRRQARAMAAGRGLWGLSCLIRPDSVLRAAGGRPDPHPTTFARVLGARELLQAAATTVLPTAGILRVGIVVDAVHALTMCSLAGVDRSRRRPALLNALTATGWALLAHHVRAVPELGPAAPSTISQEHR